MDDALVLEVEVERCELITYVLILVVMDDALVLNGYPRGIYKAIMS